MAFCLGTLVELLDQILRPHQHHKHWVLDNDKIPQIQSLFEKASFLRDFLANSTPAIQARIETLEDLIRDAAENAEDILESHIKALVLSNPAGKRFMIFPPDMTEVCQVFDSAAEEMIKIKATTSQPKKTAPAINSRSDLMTPTHLVGVDKCLIKLRDRVTSRSRALEIIPIVGMGGIGKTTLARKLYNEYSSNQHFDICLWATVSHEYDQRQILLSLLGCTKSDKKNEELKVDVHKKLWSRRYLIVLDDVWSSKVWDDIRTCSPDCNNRSRIILTTRENNLADYVSSSRHEMQLLNKEDSWELLSKIVHGGENLPNGLEEIVKKCGGLPLALQVIGGFMSRVENTKDLWEKVANDISSFIIKEDDQFSGIFSWSYANLPHHLKPCLLYIGAFPEDHDIQASRLIKLWVAEGFLYPIKDKSPEEVADIYLNALTDRNLIFVRERKFGGRVKSYGIHDLLRDLCLKKAEEKKFIFANKLVMSKDALCHRRVCVTSFVDNGDLSGAMELMSQARSLQVIDKRIFPKSGFELSLLKILDLLTINFKQFPEEILKLVNLKYLAIWCQSGIKSPISLAVLKNLQTLIFNCGGSVLPTGIFYLPQLRHLCVNSGPRTCVPRKFLLGETLQSLSELSVAVVAQLLGKLPHLKSLGIHGGDWKTEPNIDLTTFPLLETIIITHNDCLTPIFPQTLRNLTMDFHRKLSRKFMSNVGDLPNLQLLQLEDYGRFDSGTWKPSEGEFCNLQYLRLYNTYLENWIADDTHFPQLKHLFIQRCDSLKEIPLEFGGIETLEIIELDDCKSSVFDSARSILQEQRDFGNENLQLRLGYEIRRESGWFF